MLSALLLSVLLACPADGFGALRGFVLPAGLRPAAKGRNAAAPHPALFAVAGGGLASARKLHGGRFGKETVAGMLLRDREGVAGGWQGDGEGEDAGEDAPLAQQGVKQREPARGRRRAVLHPHPGTWGMPAREVRWQDTQAADEERLRRGLTDGSMCYGQLDNGRLVRGILQRVRVLAGEGNAFGCIRVVTSEGSVRTEWIPVARIFPVGGCNGGLDAELHRIVQETFRSRHPDGDVSLDCLIKALQQMSWRPKNSLLTMLSSKEPALEGIIEYLDAARLRIMQDPHGKHVLVFPAKSVRDARRAFQVSVVLGEQKLMRFCELLAHTVFADGRFARQSVVIAETVCADGKTKETFTLTEPLGDEDLCALMPGESQAKSSLGKMLVLSTDTCYAEDGLCLVGDAGERERAEAAAKDSERNSTRSTAEDSSPIPAAYRLGGRRPLHDQETRLMGEGWQHPREVAHYLAYEALTSKDISHSGVYRFFGVMKPSADVWDNVADRLCRVDAYLDAASNRGRSSADFIDDVLSVKIIVDDAQEARALVETLGDLQFDPHLLRRVDVPFYAAGADECTEVLEILYEKDDLTSEQGEGFRALRLLVRWWGVKVMLLIEPLEVFHREQERVTPESNGEHKRRRMEVRRKIAKKWPTYAFIRELLNWMFVAKDPYGMHSGTGFAGTDRVTIQLTE